MNSLNSLIENRRHAALVADLITGKISKETFKSSDIYRRMVIESAVGTSDIEHEFMLRDLKQLVQIIDIKDKSSLKKFLDSQDDCGLINKEFKKTATVKNILSKWLKGLIASDFMLSKSDRSFKKPQKDLVNLLRDPGFVEQVEKDKKHIINFEKELKKFENNPLMKKFINIGWFDEPFMNGNYEKLRKLLRLSIKQCDKWIKEEKNGESFVCEEYPEAFHISITHGNDDSWEEWKYIFPNIHKYLFGIKI